MGDVNQEIPPVLDKAPAKISNNLSFLRTLSYGFVIVSIGIIIAVGGYLLGANKTKTQPVAQISVTPSVSPTSLPAGASAKVGDPTANWQTYIVKDFGFSFKYPSTETVEVNWNSGKLFEESFYGGKLVTLETKYNENTFDLYIDENKKGISTNQIIDDKINSAIENNKSQNKVNVERNINLGQLNGPLIEMPGWRGMQNGVSAHFEFYFVKSGVLYSINLFSSDELSIKNTDRSLLNLIVSTFKFTP